LPEAGEHAARPSTRIPASNVFDMSTPPFDLEGHG
jgi:hypothetical protein